MIINDLDGYYIVFDTKNWNTELDTLVKSPLKNFREIPAYSSRLSASGSATISGTSSGNSYLLI